MKHGKRDRELFGKLGKGNGVMEKEWGKQRDLSRKRDCEFGFSTVVDAKERKGLGKRDGKTETQK